ncbi:MAG: homoserine dehydrogenase, partial [Pseudomonadales bacterium]|nr:homoserine dehydrogenase [Pseudomonadales bacterium]
MTTMRIGLCGLGTVGSGVFNTLKNNASTISAKAASAIEVVHVGARSDNPCCDTSGVRLSRDIFEVARDPDVDVLVELIGGVETAKELIETAIKNGKHIVTANKALIAEHGNTLFELAALHNVMFAYEAAVAGGIPIIKALREGLAANRIEWVAGIINGTGNFILTEMGDKGRAFDEVLKEAQELGYAEADPTFDVEGIDAAHKLVILASLAFGIPLDSKKVFTEGISRLSTRDVGYAAELGYRIKHLGIARKKDEGIELRVHPTLIPKEQVIANVDGVMNAVMVWGDTVGPTLYSGPGAGSGPTASSVIADLVDVSRQRALPLSSRVPFLGVQAENIVEQRILPIDEVESEYYLR